MTTAVAQMTGLFKEVYANKLQRLVPKTDLIARDVPFVASDMREGNVFHQPVVVQRESGWTLNTDGSAFEINDSISAVSKDAQVQGAEFLLRSRLSYAAMQKAEKAEGDSKKRAFVNATSYMVENMTESASYVREVELLFGAGAGTEALPAASLGLGQVLSVSGNVLTLTKASWAPGIWAGMEGSIIELHALDGTIHEGGSENHKITAVDLDARTVTVTTLASDAAANDIIYFAGKKSSTVISAYQKEMAGLFKIATNTGTLFNISASTYALWKATTYSAGSGSLVFPKLTKALNKPAGLGLKGEVNAYVSVPTWSDLNNDMAALRRYTDKAGGKVEQGATEIAYYTQTGMVRIKPHIYMKGGYALAFKPEDVMRLGATDITFEMPIGPEKGQIFFHVDGVAGVEMRVYWLQAILHQKPSQLLLISDIVNSDDSP